MIRVLKRGLLALIILSIPLFSAEYLYIDEISHNNKFKEEIDKIGSELYRKTGISLYLVMIKKLPKDMHIVDYEKNLAKNLKEPFVLLTFSEFDKKVDIYK